MWSHSAQVMTTRPTGEEHGCHQAGANLHGGLESRCVSCRCFMEELLCRRICKLSLQRKQRAGVMASSPGELNSSCMRRIGERSSSSEAMRTARERDYRSPVRLEWRVRGAPDWTSGRHLMCCSRPPSACSFSGPSGAAMRRTRPSRTGPSPSADSLLDGHPRRWCGAGARRSRWHSSQATSGVLLQALSPRRPSLESPALALCLVVALYSLGAHASTRRALAGRRLRRGEPWSRRSSSFRPAVADDSPFVALFWWLVALSAVGLGMLVRTIRRAADLQQSRPAPGGGARRPCQGGRRCRASTHRPRAARRRRAQRRRHASVQAGAARYRLAEPIPEPWPTGSADIVQEMGRSALAEMRRTARCRCATSDDAVELAPQPTLADLADAGRRRMNAAGTAGASCVVDAALADLAVGVRPAPPIGSCRRH